jgi:hypothetical protein
MPAGDAQRVWFPEMMDTLRARWHDGISFDELTQLRDKLDAMLEQIRSERQIRPPVFRCSRCGRVGEGAALHVSVRAMILSLARFRIASPEQTAALEKGWAGYRSKNGLDLFGKRPAAESDGFAECAHRHIW